MKVKNCGGILMAWVIALSTVSGQSRRAELVLYPGTNFIQEVFYVKDSAAAALKDGDYYSFYEGFFEKTKWTGQKIEEDQVKGIKSRGYYRRNQKDSVWTIYFAPVHESTNPFNEIREEGWYLNDKKAGIWYTFLEQGKVLRRYDFDEQLELPPIIKPRFAYPPKAREAKVEGLVSVKIIIRNCVVAKYEVIKDIGYGCGEAMIKALKEGEKLRAKYGVNPVDCSRKDEIVTNRFQLKPANSKFQIPK